MHGCKVPHLQLFPEARSFCSDVGPREPQPDLGLEVEHIETMVVSTKSGICSGQRDLWTLNRLHR